MNDKKPRIVDQYSSKQCLKIVNEAEKRAGSIPGNQGANLRAAIGDAKSAMLAIESNEKMGKVATMARDNLNTALKTIFEVTEIGGKR